MWNLLQRLLVQVVLMCICFVMVHSKCRLRCRLHLANLGHPTCPGGLVCKEKRGEHRCYDEAEVYDDPAECLPKLNSGDVSSCTLGPVDGCDSTLTTFIRSYQTDLEVVNGDVCRFSELDYDETGCEELCNSMDCLYYTFDFSIRLAKCKVFSKNCVFQAVQGCGPCEVRYRQCTTD